jgi:peptidoglycan/xylan/chitin deacetylase (PgdA/CDA1 family)
MAGAPGAQAGTMRGIGPTLPPSAKAAATRVRSAWWVIRSRGRFDPDGLRILFYHRISDDDDALAVAPGRFRRQMELLASAGYSVIDLCEAAKLLLAGTSPHKTIVLNFDDGFRDVAENALPVLEELGFPATVFVATGVTDGTSSFAWYRRQPPLLGWGEVAELDREGRLRFGAHTISHPNLLALADDAARDEIAGSKIVLEAKLGREVEAFCYPAGLFSDRDRALAAAAGFRLAVSCEPGVNRPGEDQFALRRRQIDPRDSLLDFRAKLGGGHDTPLPLRGVYRRLRYGEGKSGAASRVLPRASLR